MSRRMLLPLALGALLLGGVPALADANGSTETTTETRSCGAAPDNQYSEPGPTDCRTDGQFDPSKTYEATRYTNDVRCGSSAAPTSPTGVHLYGAGDQGAMSGRAGLCSDGSGSLPAQAPVQGRVGAEGSQSDGVKVLIDGDKDNAAPNGNETARGWATVEAEPAPAAPKVTCGDEHSQGGRADTDSPQERDTQAECGSGT